MKHPEQPSGCPTPAEPIPWLAQGGFRDLGFLLAALAISQHI